MKERNRTVQSHLSTTFFEFPTAFLFTCSSFSRAEGPRLTRTVLLYHATAQMNHKLTRQAAFHQHSIGGTFHWATLVRTAFNSSSFAWPTASLNSRALSPDASAASCSRVASVAAAASRPS